MGLINSDTLKTIVGVVIVSALALGDFFFSHRLAADSDVILVLTAVGYLGLNMHFGNVVKLLSQGVMKPKE